MLVVVRVPHEKNQKKSTIFIIGDGENPTEEVVKRTMRARPVFTPIGGLERTYVLLKSFRSISTRKHTHGHSYKYVTTAYHLISLCLHTVPLYRIPLPPRGKEGNPPAYLVNPLATTTDRAHSGGGQSFACKVVAVCLAVLMIGSVPFAIVTVTVRSKPTCHHHRHRTQCWRSILRL